MLIRCDNTRRRHDRLPRNGVRSSTSILVEPDTNAEPPRTLD
jgi:hypothetical protein